MVRTKLRWLLVRVDAEGNVFDYVDGSSLSDKERQLLEIIGSPSSASGAGGTTPSDAAPMVLPNEAELMKAIRANIRLLGGIAASGAANDTSLRYFDRKSRLALFRTPREFCGIVRASLTLVTRTEEGRGGMSQRVVLSTLSVHGGARLAKLAMIQEIRKFYRTHAVDLNRRNGGGAASATDESKDTANQNLCESMENTISAIMEGILH